MKRTFRFSLYLLIAWISFLLFSCAQTHFAGTVVRGELSDVQVRFNDGEFQSIYEPGTNLFRVPPVPSKHSVATVKVVVGGKDVRVKIKGSNASPSPGKPLEFVRKLHLKTGENVVPIVAYRDSEEKGFHFSVYIEKKPSEGALRLTHLKCKYVGFIGEGGTARYVDTDDFVDELPLRGEYERSVATPFGVVFLEVGSPDIDEQIIEVDGATIDSTLVPSDPADVVASPSSPSPPLPLSGDYKTYKIPLKDFESTMVDITVRDTNKNLAEHFYLKLRPIDKDERESTDIAKIILTTEDGDIFDFEELDMADISPYIKGRDEEGESDIEIENIFKLRELLAAPFNGIKPTVTITPEVPGTKVEIMAFWKEVDHDQEDPSGGDGFKLSEEMGWEYYRETDFKDYDNYPRQKVPVFLGKMLDTEFNFTPYTHRKFDFLIKVTSPDGTKSKYHEVKYNFPFGGALIFLIEPFQAMVSKDGETYSKSTVVKADYEEGLYNVYVPHDCTSVRLVADDRYHVNFATGYRSSYADIWDYRFYLALDDGDFSRRHPNAGSGTERNYKEISLDSSIGIEEHKLSIVSYQDGVLKDGKFVDEYGKESGVVKVQNDFQFKFIRENREVAPSLSVLKVEGTQVVPSSSAVNGKIWPTFSFRPAIHDYKLPLLQSDVTYKLKMLKADKDSQIFVDGVELTTTETFTQNLMSVAGFPEEINDPTADNVSFFSYELKHDDGRYYEGGFLKPCTVIIGVRKGNLYREYSLEIQPVDPDQNEVIVNVVDAVGGSARSGTKILYKEHEPAKEIQVTTEGKVYEGQFALLGTTGFDGTVSGKGYLKAGRYYDIYALGNDTDLTDSMISHYYVTGEEGEIINLVQMSLVQNGGADYQGGKAIRGNCPVRLKKQVETKGTSGNPDVYRDGDFFFFRQKTTGGIGGGTGVWQLKPINLTCGDAHIRMDDSLAGANTDMIVWFDVSLGNSIEPVSWGPDGVIVAFDSMPFSYSYHMIMTDYNPNGQIGMEPNSVEQQARMKWNFPSGCYDLILVAYDVAGNRLERHQYVSIESHGMMRGPRVGGSDEKDERRLKLENFRTILFRWPTKMNIFAHKEKFEKLFGMPWTEYIPPEGQGDPVKNPSTCLVIARSVISDDLGYIDCSGVTLYRRCVDDNTPFKKVAATVPELKLTAYGVMDADFSLEVGKTYQYKMVATLDEGNAIESEYLAEVRIPPAFMYFLDSIKVEGQGGGVQDGVVYKYNANKKDKDIPVLKTKKYSSDVKDEDKTRIKIDYRARLSTAELWDKDESDEIEFGITLCKRDNTIVFASKCIIAFDDDGEEVLLLYIPTQGRFVELDDLIKMGWAPRNTAIDDLITFDRRTCLLTIKDAYLRIPALNWAVLFFGNSARFNYEPGNTYYWDVVSFGRGPYGGNVSPMSFLKTFDAKKKDAPNEKHFDEDGDAHLGAYRLVMGNGDYDGGNSINGKCRFTVVEE